MTYRFKSEIIIASFIVAVFSSLLVALGIVLLRVASSTLSSAGLFIDYFFNIYILFIFSTIVFFKGSSTAAWLIYKPDVPWGQKLGVRLILPIFILALFMSLIVFLAVNYAIQTELSYLVYLEHPLETVRQLKIL